MLKCAGKAAKANGHGAEQKTESMKPVWLKLAQAVVAATAPLRLANGPGTAQDSQSAGVSAPHPWHRTTAACITDACAAWILATLMLPRSALQLQLGTPQAGQELQACNRHQPLL